MHTVTPPSINGLSAASIILVLAALGNDPAAAADRTWVGGNNDWVDGGLTTYWNPADEPDANDAAIFIIGNSLNLGSNNTVNGLSMSGGVSLNTNGFDLTIDGPLQLTDLGTDLTVTNNDSAVLADSATISSNASIIMDGGVLGIDEETGFGVLDINSTATFTGVGTLNLNDDILGGATSLLVNDGTISATRPGIFLGAPVSGTLSINAPGDIINARLDLDGFGLSALLRVSRNQTLDINVPLLDNYSDDIDLFHNATLDMSHAWSIDGNATIDVDNGFVNNGGIFDVPASTSFINGGEFTQAAGTTITVIDGDGALQFNAPFTMSGGNLVNNGEVIFNAAATIADVANFTMPTGNSSLTINAGVVVNVDQSNFNPDGTDTITNVITIGSLGILDLDLGAGADTNFGNVIALKGGELDVTTATDTWSITGIIDVESSTGTSQINGEVLTLSSVPVTVGNGSTLDVNATSTWASTASAAAGTGSILRLDGSASVLSGASFTGAGTLFIGSTSTVSASTTVATGTFDWDGLGAGSVQTINNGVVFTINSVKFDTDGDMDDPINLGGSGAGITVNGPVSWVMKNTLTSNPADTGLATIGGISRMILETAPGILNASGDTTINAPITFGALSTTNVAATAILTVNGNAIYHGGIITGAGSYRPPIGSNNIVSADSTISITNFNFDYGDWEIMPDAKLTVNVDDYETDNVINVFDGIISLNNSTIDVTTGDAEFVIDNILNSSASGSGQSLWTGEPLVIGNDIGVLNSDVNISGDQPTQFGSQVKFKSDADFDVSADATAHFLAQVNFDSVEGGNNAEFTGPGQIIFSGAVNVNEATTLNFSGGIVDLDGADSVGDTINIDAPFTINTEIMRSFGKNNAGGGTNILDVNHDVNNNLNTGALSVNLDNAADEWTLNSFGVMNLVNDNTSATMLAGSGLNLNGTLNVTGDVRTDARMDIGSSALINILTVGEPFRLSGGDFSATNTISGGTIAGPGLLGADSGSVLTGFGTIAANANIDFDGSSDLLADNGTLTVNSALIDVRNIGTADFDGILNVPNAWVTPGGCTVLMQGGELQGGNISLTNPSGITGHGLVSARVSNGTIIQADSVIHPLVIETAGSNNDWDGTSDNGTLQAINSATLDLRDNATFLFDGTVSASSGGTVLTNGFELDMEPGSNLNLTGGTFATTVGIASELGGTITIGSGTSNLLINALTGSFTFVATSATTLSGNLQLDAPNTIVRAGATFAGGGHLINLAGRTLAPDNLANMNILLENRGIYSPAANLPARNDLLDYTQSTSGVLAINLNGTTPGAFDNVFAIGNAKISGALALTLGGGYVPALNDTFIVLTAVFGVDGTFDPLVQPVGMPEGLIFEVIYTPTLVQLQVVADVSPFETWINSFGSLTDPADKTKEANPDDDDLNNLGEFALDGDPTSGVTSGKVVGKIASVGGVDAMTLTIPVRSGAILDPGDPVGGELVLKQAADELTYRIQATDDLAAFTLDVTEVTGPDATAIQVGLPTLNIGWVYRSFRSPGPVAGDPVEFMRVVISE